MTLGKSFPFPVLSEDSMDYIDGTEYSANISYRKDAGIVVSHQITNGNFVSELISQDAAKFACLVSRPSSMFRKVFVHDGQGGGNLIASQIITPADFYSPDILEGSLFRPMVLVNRDVNEKIKATHGLDKTCWGEGGIVVPRGGIIAFENWKYLKNSSASSIFKFLPSDKLSGGQISVEDNTDGGFKFVVYMDKELFDAMRKPSSDKNHVRSILTHALSRGFEILKNEYPESWKDYPYLNLLAGELDARDILHWSDDGFKPEIAATSLYPHKPPKSTEEFYNE